MRGMYSKLPRYVMLNKEKFIINTDFRIFIDFEEEMQGTDLQKAVIKALQRFYPAFNLILSRNLLDEAVNKFIWFYKCGKDKEPKPTKGKSNGNQVFSYSYDDMYIWSAYKSVYNVDISRQYIHWWKFRAMWVALPSDTEICKIKSYRAYTGKDKDLLELKEYYKLPPTQKEIADRIRQNKIYEALK